MNIDLAVDVTGAIARCGWCDGQLVYDPAYGELQLIHHGDGSHTTSWEVAESEKGPRVSTRVAVGPMRPDPMKPEKAPRKPRYRGRRRKAT